MQTSADTGNNFTEYAIAILADGDPIWFSNRVLLSRSTEYSYRVKVEWFAQHVHVFFAKALTSDSAYMVPTEPRNSQGGGWAAAYFATLYIYDTSLQENLLATVQLDSNGTNCI
jgi:hypothetical protein